jgi:acyl transferase domain-containing protein
MHSTPLTPSPACVAAALLARPCVPTNTACSSSLVAAHLAAVAVKQHECTFAAAAGANAMLLPLGATAAMTQVQALAPDGR